MDKELLIRLDSGWPDDLRVLERKNIRLRDELEWLDAVGGTRPLSTGDAPKETKAAEAFDGDCILGTLGASGGMRTSLVDVLLAWVQRHRHRSLLSPDQPQRALKAFLVRRTGAAD